MCVSVYNVSMCVFVLEAVIVLLLCLVYIAVDFLCLCLRLCVCVCSCVHVYASVCFTVYVCASVVRICVCLPGRRLLRWAEDALRHPLASFQLLQIAICQLLTFISIFLSVFLKRSGALKNPLQKSPKPLPTPLKLSTKLYN